MHRVSQTVLSQADVTNTSRMNHRETSIWRSAKGLGKFGRYIEGSLVSKTSI